MESRKIKFRIWDKVDKEWTSYPPIFSSAHGKIFEFFASQYQFENLVIQQYTGLKDKNDKEIYEGDIIKFYKWNSPQKNKEDYLCKDNKKVVWGLDYGQYPYAGWTVISLKPTDLEDGYPLNHMDQRNMEVIGNIYENPELLHA